MDTSIYDKINAHAIRILAYLYDNKESICVVDYKDKVQFNWFMKMLKHLSVYKIISIDFEGNFFKFLYLRYIKHYKFLKYYNSKLNSFKIYIPEFIEEMCNNWGVETSIINDIYNTYYT